MEQELAVHTYKDTYEQATQTTGNQITDTAVCFENDLASSESSLEEAKAVLDSIETTHIDYLLKVDKPPHIAMLVMDCVLILFQKKLQPVVPDATVPCPAPSWDESLKIMQSSSFIQHLKNYPKEMINDEMKDLLCPYLIMEDHNFETASHECGNMAGLLLWIKKIAS